MPFHSDGKVSAVRFDWFGGHGDRPSHSSATDVYSIIGRVKGERREQIRPEVARLADLGLWPDGWPHEAPDRPLTVPDAHKTMQRHRGCRVDECPRKQAAWRTLIDAGRLNPGSDRRNG